MNRFDDFMQRKNNGTGATCIRCKSIVLSPGALGPTGMLCGMHYDDYLQKEAHRARAKEEERRRIVRTFIQERAEAAIPGTYSVMVGDQEGADELHMVSMIEKINERVHTRDNARIIQAAREAAHDALFKRGMVVLFAGPTGVGKSHMLAFTLRTMANFVPLEPPHTNSVSARKSGGIFSDDWPHEGSDPAILWTSAKKLFEAAKRDEDIRPYEDVSVLVLDDIGNEPRQVNITVAHDIVFDRYDNKKTIFASTGYMDEHADPTDLDAFLAPLAERYDKAFVRRLAKVPETVRVIPMLPPT